jgi:Uma2 family endonuclease
MVQLQMQQIVISPGQRVLIQDIDWDGFELILKELGESRGSRVAYSQGMLEIRMPLPEHEANKEVLGDLLKAALEELDVEFLTLGSTTFKNQAMLAGIEPDQCFYIHHEPDVRGKTKLDLKTDPPPDLALEIDVTSRTQISAYELLKVPEIWRYAGGEIQVFTLQEGRYQQVSGSPLLSTLLERTEWVDRLPEFVSQVKQEGRNKVLKRFRAWVRDLPGHPAPPEAG